jgi:prepilin-type N-terminal cleavage/methylation domain-containing protein
MRRRGFTIIELLVVVGIIVALISILVPALAAVRKRAYKAGSQGLLNSVGSAIMTYHSHFAAYPGPASARVTTGAVAAGKITGAQNLMLGLTYSLSPSVSGTPDVPADGSTPGRNVTMRGGFADSSGPINYAVVKPDNTNEKLSPFFQPNDSQIANDGSTTKTVTGTGITAIPPKLPLLVDNFPDALPVLYFRRTVGVDGPAARVNDSTSTPTPTPFSYFLSENREIILAADLKSVSGAIFDQTPSALNNNDATGPTDFSKVFGGGNPRGGFVLIAPGFDRIYGTANGNYDDITFVGGD